ncbi:hypothetical protein ACVWYN_001490 [Pedobacter sp. UYP24]
MKRIVIIIAVLFIAIVTMAYLYFGGLITEQKNNDHSLQAITGITPLIFSFENDESILDILSGQDLLQQIIGPQKFTQLHSLANHLLKIPAVGPFFSKQNVYIGICAGKEKNLDFLYTTQISNKYNFQQLVQRLKSAKVKISLTSKNPVKIELSDSSVFYVGNKDNLLLLSSSAELVTLALKKENEKDNKFADFIKTNSRITKNSLAEVYVNFEKLSDILENTMPGSLNGELSLLNKQPAYAALVYNYSKDKILLTGTTTVDSKDTYYNLFLSSKPNKTTINSIVPDITANYSTYFISNYQTYHTGLKNWFRIKKEEKSIDAAIKTMSNVYHIDMQQLLPKYFKDQMITFQLSNGEKLGAINLSNGDKLAQLLIDLSSPYNEDIKLLNVNDLLYSFFGEAFKKFKRPYYTIVDNYLIFSNSASGLSAYLESYRSGKLLINNNNYTNTINQLPSSASINFYIDLENSTRIIQKNIYLPFFRHIYSEDGLKSYSSIVYQLSSDNGKFLSNFLMTKKLTRQAPDSLIILH